MVKSIKFKASCEGCSEAADCVTYKNDPKRTESVDIIRVVGSLEPTGELIGGIAIGNCGVTNKDVAIATGVLSPDRVAQIDNSSISLNLLPLADVMPDTEFRRISNEMDLLPAENTTLNGNGSHRTVTV